MEAGYEVVILSFFLIIGFFQGSKKISDVRSGKTQGSTQCDNLLDYLTLKDIYKK
jgi:hypothetical protein